MAESLVDALTHLADPRLGDVRDVLTRAAAAGVGDAICANVDPAAPWPRRADDAPAVRLWPAYGLHPQALRDEHLEADLEAVAQAVGQGDAVAVGEVGLDGRVGMPPMALQERALRRQLALAARAGLPVILHCVHAVARLCAVLDEVGVGPGGVWHGFVGPAELLPQLARAHVACSFGGVVARPQARRARAAAQAIDAAHLLVESDAPDQPAPGCGPQSEPGHLPVILEALAELRGEGAAELAERSAANARRLYKLPVTAANS